LPNLLLNYHHQHQDHSQQDSIIQVATAAMAVAVVLAYPLNIFPARVTLIGLLEKQKDHPLDQNTRTNDERNDMDTVRHGSRTSTNTARRPNATLTQALMLDDHQVMEQQQQQERTAAPDGTTTRSGSTCVCTKNGETVPLTAAPTRDSNGPPTSSTTASFDWQQHVVITLFLNGTSLAVALMIPNISVLFGILGATASNIFGFCVPGGLGIQLARDLQHETGQRPWNTFIISWLLLVGRAVVGAITTVATIYELSRQTLLE
jgi:Transmembrane amino acid transporter protein